MEEKILIYSRSSEKVKRFFTCLIIALLVLSVIFLFVWIPRSKHDFAWHVSTYWCRWASTKVYGYSCCFCDDIFTSQDSMYDHILNSHIDEMGFIWYLTEGLPWSILHWSFLFLAGISWLIYFLMSRCRIVVTEKNITGITVFGKKVVLPLHMISAYSTSKFFSVISITTASGSMRFPCIENNEKIANVLQELLNKRQKKTETQEDVIPQTSSSTNLDDLVKLKRLLDDGIITQEEFNAKKKEILKLK